MLFMAKPGVLVIRAVPAKRAPARGHRVRSRSKPAASAGKISTYRVLEPAQVPEILVSIPEGDNKSGRMGTPPIGRRLASAINPFWPANNPPIGLRPHRRT